MTRATTNRVHGVSRLSVLVAIASVGCGRISFDPIPVAASSDGRTGDGTSDTTATCSGSMVATCPVTVRSISTGQNVHESGTTTGLADGRSGSCGGAAGGEFILELDIAQFGFYTISTAGSDFDTVIYVFDGTCTAAEFDCRNAVAGPGGETMMLGVAHAGPFTIVVDGDGGCGHFELDIQG